MTQPIPASWSDPAWLAATKAWIRDALAEQGIAVTGPITQPHNRPWSTVLHVPTERGVLYCKAMAPALRHELALLTALTRWHPQNTPRVLAVDEAHNRLLLADGGVPLRTLVKPTRNIRPWYEVLPLYAQLQINLAPRRDDLLALGVPDRRPATLPDHLRDLLADRESLLIDQVDGMTSAQYGRLQSLLPRYTDLCAQLAASGLPETLDHGDFHGNNIFVQNGRYTFADWGDSCITHPFVTLVATLRSIAYHLELAADAPELQRARDAYLEPWTTFAPRADLDAALNLALIVGMVTRAITWREAMAHLAPADRAEYAEAVPGWLLELLEALVAAGH